MDGFPHCNFLQTHDDFTNRVVSFVFSDDDLELSINVLLDGEESILEFTDIPDSEVSYGDHIVVFTPCLSNQGAGVGAGVVLKHGQIGEWGAGGVGVKRGWIGVGIGIGMGF